LDQHNPGLVFGIFEIFGKMPKLWKMERLQVISLAETGLPKQGTYSIAPLFTSHPCVMQRPLKTPLAYDTEEAILGQCKGGNPRSKRPDLLQHNEAC
jgi:hypothetical protein